MAEKTQEEIAAEKAAADKAAAAKKTEKRARVLLDHDGNAVNSIVTGATAERAIAEGWGDGHPSAVEYAEKLARAAKRAAGEDDE